MKRLLLAIFILAGLSAYSQPTTVNGYTTINSGYNWLRVLFRAANLPVGCGYPALKTGQWTGSGAIYLDSCYNSNQGRLYYYQQGEWVPIMDSLSVLNLVKLFGVSGQDDIATQNRSFDNGNYNFSIFGSNNFSIQTTETPPGRYSLLSMDSTQSKIQTSFDTSYAYVNTALADEGGGDYTAPFVDLVAGSTVVNSHLHVHNDRIEFHAYDGNFDIEGLKNTTSDAVTLMTWDSLTNRTAHIPLSSISGGGDLQTTLNLGDTAYGKSIHLGDSLKSNYLWTHGIGVIGDSVKSGKIAYFNGHSVMIGEQLTLPAYERYSYLICKKFGWTEVNYGITGTTMHHYTAGDSCMEERYWTIPTYNSATDAAYFLQFDINDANNTFSGDTSIFRTAFVKTLDTMFARGWPANRIILITTYVDNASYTAMEDFSNCVVNIASDEGVIGVDLYHYMEDHDPLSWLNVDQIHPNALGHNRASSKISTYLPFNHVGELLVNGGVWVKDSMRVNNFIRVSDNSQTYSGSSWNLINGGTSFFLSTINIGSTTSKSAKINEQVSTNQSGLTVWEGSTSNENRHYAYGNQVTNGTNTLGYYYDRINMLAGLGIYFTGSGANNYVWFGRNGGTEFALGSALTGSLDSAIKTQSLRVWRGVRLDGLPSGGTANDSVLVVNSTGTVYKRDAGAFGTSPLFKLSGSATATGSVTGDMDGNDFTVTNAQNTSITSTTGAAIITDNGSDDGSGYFLNQFDFDSYGTVKIGWQKSTDSSFVDFTYKNAAEFKINKGADQIFTVNVPYSIPDTSSLGVMGYNKTTGEWVWTNWAYAGGTGLTNPMTSTGDMIYSSDGSGTPARLAAGTNGDYLQMSAGIPTWVAAPAASLTIGGGITGGTANSFLVEDASNQLGESPYFTFGGATIYIGESGAATGSIVLDGATSGSVGIAPQNAAGTWTLTLPTSGGTTGYFLQTNGSGLTTWAAATSAAAGNQGNIQLNNGGALGTPGSDSLTYNANGLDNKGNYFGAESGTATVPSFAGRTDTNTGFGVLGSADHAHVITGGTARVLWNTTETRLARDYKLTWSGSAGGTYAGGADVGISRSSAGLLQVNSGTAGTYRDMLMRKLNINVSGTNDAMGTATLSSGTITVNTTQVTASSKIFVTVDAPGGTQGFLSVPSASIVAGTSFVINSTSGTESSTVFWWIVN